MASFEKDDSYIKVVDIIADKISIDKAVIKPESTFQELGADSLDVVEIIMRLEEQFGVEIKDEEAEELESVQSVVNYIHEKRTR